MRTLRSESGIVVVFAAIVMFMLMGFAALAIDVGHLYVVSNELKNAGDAGALAGAAELINDDGSVNTGSNVVAQNAAMENLSDRDPVEVLYNPANDNVGDVQRGHWSFGNQIFTPSSYTGPFDYLLGKTQSELDTFDPAEPFINAVSVVTRREATPAVSFFARIFGKEGFAVGTTESVAYLGSPGSLGPGEIDAPIAICHEAIYDNGAYDCVTGRMLNDGGNPSSHETAMWTDYEQQTNCPAASNSDIRDLLNNGNCGGLDMDNPDGLSWALPLDATNGVLDNTFRDLRDIWENCATYDPDDDPHNNNDLPIDEWPLGAPDGIPDRPWKLTLPVVLCDAGSCAILTGAVTIELIWMIRDGETSINSNKYYDEVPIRMLNPLTNSYWTCPDPAGAPDKDTRNAMRKFCWDDFVQTFALQNLDKSPAPYDAKSIYFLPSCDGEEPRGTTGGGYYGIRAEIPVLVK